MLTSIILASAMICFHNFFALFVRAFARDLLSMNEYGMFQKKKKKKENLFKKQINKLLVFIPPINFFEIIPSIY